MKTSAASTRMGGYSLAIDTSAGTTVAVLSMGTVLAELNYLEPMTHSERIGSAIQKVLNAAGLKPNQIDTVVAGVGPGPFTGLRVGLAAARYFAIGSGADLVSVCSLDSIALDFYQANPNAKNLVVTTDARRKEVFWASYSGVINGIPQRTQGPAVNKEQDIANYIDLASHESTELGVRAGALGQIAFAQGLSAAGKNKNITPIYLREPDAVPSKGKKVSG
jgi:tRNA threonylcarbamoyl adenosine modification protein YeaZ